MASGVHASNSFQFITGLRGFHMHQNTENWKTFIGQRITFQWELSNVHDRFAVTGRVSLPNKPVTVRHVPRELSHHIWYTLLKGASIKGSVKNEKAKASPLVQGVQEIIMQVTVEWSNERYLKILQKKVT